MNWCSCATGSVRSARDASTRVTAALPTITASAPILCRASASDLVRTPNPTATGAAAVALSDASTVDRPVKSVLPPERPYRDTRYTYAVASLAASARVCWLDSG